MSEKATADGLCPVCGTRGPGGGESFCEVCGTLIDWDTAPSPEAASEPSRAAEEEAADRGRTSAAAGPRPGASETVSRADGEEEPVASGPKPPTAPESAAASEESAAERRSGEGPPAGGPTPAPEAGDGGVGGTASPAAGRAASSQRDQDDAGDAADAGRQRARALLVPVPDAESAEEGVGAVLPGRPVPARPEVRAARADDESGIVCPRCGVDNRPDRLFCRNDGTPLSGVLRAEAPSSGQRPAGWRPRIPWKRVLVIAGALCVLVGAAFLTPVVIREVNEHFSDPAPLPPTAVSASNADAAHPAQAAFDGVSNSWWGTGYSGDSSGQYLQANYGKPVALEKVIITPGASERVEDRSQARPEQVEVLITDSRGRSTVRNYTLADGGVQVVEAEMDDVVQVAMIVRSAYGSADDKQVAIAEVEMFGRS
ncbi:NADase-type glycan-binding domain-containing protein [Streptomyces cadmiisoli]|uniref:NADase-type glycan-binding domain-containing protein n=1 Tax=Streptomyces cadmiisoli TaxID=2184053 RepID=UPI003D744535